jgi:general secretion pathway protein F
VVPQVVDVFQQSRQRLPLLTRALISLSDFLGAAWPYLLLLAGAGFAAARMAMRSESARLEWHGLLLRLPWAGSLIRSVNTSRFASTLAILVGGGVPLLSALASGERVMTNLVMRQAVEKAIGRVREGASLARALGEAQAFPPLLVHLVASGEVSGRLERMLNRAAHLETQALERRLAVFLTLLEPAMILLMGAVVLLIVLAILLPIIEINQLVH